MEICIELGRKYQRTDPDRSMEQIEKLKILHDVLKSVNNFESKLLSELDVD
jgi:hypothetical protein